MVTQEDLAPAGAEYTVLLRDGSAIHVRPIRPADELSLLAFFRGLSERSRAQRFFVPPSDSLLAKFAVWETQIDPAHRFGLVTLVGDNIVGHASYVVVSGDRAEVAMAVADAYQGRGIGTMLLRRLAEIASANGIDFFEADMLAENDKMFEAFRESFSLEGRIEAGVRHICFSTKPTR